MAKNTKKYIKDFIDHVNKLENEEDDRDGSNGFDKEYMRIHEFQLQKRRENAFPVEAGKLQENLKKNRYKDILPYDEHRIVLSKIEGDPESDYINASKLMGVKGTGGYIASQGPLATTVNDFWRMAWEFNVEIIFMSCRIVELGKIKCKQYWNDEGKADDFGDINVYTEKEKEMSPDFIIRDFLVTRGDEKRHVIQFHYSGWPDHGIPRDPAHIRDLIGHMRTTRKNDESPLIVHCSAGCGRTGAIIAIDFVWTLLEEGRFDDTFSLEELICTFREQRMSIVQTAEQYALVNQVLRSLCEEWVAKMASHTYENVEIQGDQPLVNLGTEQNSEDDEYVYMIPVLPEDSTKATKPTSPGPEIIELSRPLDKSKLSSNSKAQYQNVILPSEQKRPPSRPPSGEVSPVHKTLIQIGSSTNGTKQHQQDGASDTTVFYYKDNERQTSVPTRAASLPHHRTSGGSISSDEVRVPLRHTASVPYDTKGQPKLIKQSAVKEPSTEFGQRLARVSGPVPLPQSWDKA